MKKILLIFFCFGLTHTNTFWHMNLNQHKQITNNLKIKKEFNNDNNKHTKQQLMKHGGEEIKNLKKNYILFLRHDQNIHSQKNF